MGDYIDVVPNYTGPYLSNGQVRESVAFGSKPPKNKLDALSRLHDTAYARYSDKFHRTVADLIYAYYCRKYLKGDALAKAAAALVTYGNFTQRAAENLFGTAPGAAVAKTVSSPLALASFVGSSVFNYKLLWDIVHKGEKVDREIRKMYRTEDPYPEYQFDPEHEFTQKDYEIAALRRQNANLPEPDVPKVEAAEKTDSVVNTDPEADITVYNPSDELEFKHPTEQHETFLEEAKEALDNEAAKHGKSGLLYSLPEDEAVTHDIPKGANYLDYRKMYFDGAKGWREQSPTKTYGWFPQGYQLRKKKKKRSNKIFAGFF